MVLRFVFGGLIVLHAMRFSCLLAE
jgi:hypothetical protein